VRAADQQTRGIARRRTTGQTPQGSAERGAAAAGRPQARSRSQELIALVTRLVTVQAGVAAAIGLSYSRRHLPSIIITLMLVVALLGLVAVTRSASHAAWIVAIGFESAYVAFGLFRFFTSRYLGGTLLGIITLGVLLHPAVARAFSGRAGADEAPAADGADEPLHGHAPG
jgi:hypothetical protein